MKNTKIMSNSTQLKYIDLFCGIGGFHQALGKFGHKCVFACDKDKHCRQTYENNYGIKPEGDITKIDIQAMPNFDILCGGFPCQTFSNAGKKKSTSVAKGQLFLEIVKIAKIKQPRFMFLENVKHIKKVDDGKAYKMILDEIRKIGYHVDDDTIFELSPHQLGIPQQRERIIFVCIREDIYDETKPITISDSKVDVTFDGFFETDTAVTNQYKISGDILKVLNAWEQMIKIFDVNETLSPTIMCNEFYKDYTTEEWKKLTTEEQDEIVKPKKKRGDKKKEPHEFDKYTNKKYKELVPWRREYIRKNIPIYNKYKSVWDKWYNEHGELLSKREIYGKLEWQAGKKKEKDSIFNYFIQPRQSGIRVKKSKYFPTLVAIVQTPIYGKEKRYITPRECARLQSFPETFKIHENDRIAYKQFGNAVNVEVIYKVIYETFRAYSMCRSY